MEVYKHSGEYLRYKYEYRIIEDGCKNSYKYYIEYKKEDSRKWKKYKRLVTDHRFMPDIVYNTIYYNTVAEARAAIEEDRKKNCYYIIESFGFESKK